MNQHSLQHKMELPHLHGWLSSIALHGLVLLSLSLLFRQSPTTPPSDPFRWDVVLVQSTSTAHELAQMTDIPQPAVPTSPDRRSTASHANRPIRQATRSTDRIASRISQTEAPDTSPSETATTSISNDLPPTPAQAPEPPRQQTDMPIGSAAQAPPQLETTAAAPIEESARRTDAVQPSPLSATALDTTAVSEIRPDYSWLQQAIFRRLEELKRSSRPSLDDSRPLKVMVKAVVSREGTLLDFVVVKSSGLDRIDQEAMALVQRAFPMQLDRPLGRQQVAMRIPITYSRE